jgi:hypothetical protein
MMAMSVEGRATMLVCSLSPFGETAGVRGIQNHHPTPLPIGEEQTEPADRSRLSIVIPVTVKLVAATTAFFIMPSARRLTDRIVTQID